MLDPAELASMAQPVSYPALGVHDPTSASSSGAISATGSLPTGAQCPTEPHPIATLPHEGNAVDAAARSLPPHPLQSQLLRDQPELLEAGITERARNMRVTSYMFDLLSKKTQIKHPLCEVCIHSYFSRSSHTLFLYSFAVCSADMHYFVIAGLRGTALYGENG